MSLSTPTTGATLLALGKKMYAGLVALAQTLKITQITPVDFLAFVSDFETADNNFNAARSEQQRLSGLYQTALTGVSDYLAAVKGVLLSAFGTGYSTQWVQAGFINNSTQIPTTVAGRMALTGRLVAFFTKNPSYEVANLKVTAAQGTAVQNAASQAQQNLTTSTRALKDLGTTWDNAFQALSDEEWTLIKLLQATLNSDDTRWLAFGLPMPSQTTTPGQPTGLTAQLNNAGGIVVQCDATPLATRYRFRMLIVGVDTKYALAVSSPSPMGAITNVEPGQTVQLMVQAVNGNQQGVASDPIQFTIPLPVKSSPEPKAAAPASDDSVVTLSNGHSNGNGRAPREASRTS